MKKPHIKQSGWLDNSIKPGIVRMVFIFFFLSGMSGLVIENVLSRMLRLIMGNTVFSTTTVVCAFMGGLALGGLIGGWLAARRRDYFRMYGLLELSIGIYCLSLPWLLALLEPVYKFIYQNLNASFYVFSLVKFMFCLALLLFPTVMMGATLPILCRFLTKNLRAAGASVGRLYAVNTFGGVLGAFSAGFILMPLLGTHHTLHLACVINITVGAIAYTLSRSSRQAEPDKPTTVPDIAVCDPGTPTSFEYHKAAPAILLAGYALAGMTALTYEIAWTRAISLTMGSSVYSFSLVLTAFLLGIARGSSLYSRYEHKVKRPLLTLGILVALIGSSALITVPICGYLPLIIVRLTIFYSNSFLLLHLAKFVVMFFMVLMPTILMGAAFPLACRTYALITDRFERSVGNIYAANTLGAILGTFAAGFILIPTLGVRNTILAAVGINILIGITFFLMSEVNNHKKTLFSSLFIISMTAAIMAMPAWDNAVMSSGAYHIPERFRLSNDEPDSLVKQRMKENQILFHKEGVSTTVTVKELQDGERILYVNGKPDASTVQDVLTQVLLAHIPMLLHPDPQHVLVVGLASGMTLYSASLHPGAILDCVEISPEMVQASEFFTRVNHHVLDQESVNLIINDGRNHLALTDRKYDVIISEPSNPWIAGIGDLFTREYFQLCRQALHPDGIVCIWLQSYAISEDLFKSVLYTFSQVFPETMVFESLPMIDFMIIGSANPIQIDLHRISDRFQEKAVLKDLEMVNIDTIENLLGRLVMNGDILHEYLAGSHLHTDDNALIEFNAPKYLYNQKQQYTIAAHLREAAPVDLSFIISDNAGDRELENVKHNISNRIKAEQLGQKALILLNEYRYEEAFALSQQAAALDPKGPPILNFYAKREAVAQACQLFRQDRIPEAIARAESAILFAPNLPEAHLTLGMLLQHSGRLSRSVEYYRNAVRLQPDNMAAVNALAWLLAVGPNDNDLIGTELAILEQTILASPNYRQNHVLLGTLAAICARTGRMEQAITYARRAAELADQKGLEDIASQIRQQLSFYNQNKPFRLY
ncbi:MAG: fused MFS/spermidine synthase [Sedimentisphaerales bacterium]|nr:fused MFS/spermidine synthase [Sedimentisphaerales bacterium]